MKKYLVLHNIRSAHNIGAMFRTAEAIGISKIYLSGFSARPTDRFGRTDQKVCKSAVGSENLVEWEYFETYKEVRDILKKANITIIAVEQHYTSVDYKSYTPQSDVAVIMGNEITGVEKELLDSADIVMDIPMYGEKESLNVATSCGIVLYQLFD